MLYVRSLNAEFAKLYENDKVAAGHNIRFLEVFKNNILCPLKYYVIVADTQIVYYSLFSAENWPSWLSQTFPSVSIWTHVSR